MTLAGYVGRKCVLDHGYVEMIDSMGDDLAIVNGARQSFDAYSERHMSLCDLVTGGTTKMCTCNDLTPGERNFMSKADKGLINFLMRERHTSPFELVTAKFAVQLPIFVAREWMRHRTQSFNEMSGRYTQLPRLFYVPARDQMREQKGKPGAYHYERIEDDAMAEQVRSLIDASANLAFTDYEMMLERGVAKEVARLVLPVNTYTKFVVSANLLNWMRFLSLRNEPSAQWEIQQYAKAIEEQLIAVAPVAMEKFVEHGRLR